MISIDRSNVEVSTCLPSRSLAHGVVDIPNRTQSVNTPKLLTASLAAQALAISPRKLWSLTHSGDIPHVRIGRCARYPLSALQDWIAENQIGGAK